MVISLAGSFIMDFLPYLNKWPIPLLDTNSQAPLSGICCVHSKGIYNAFHRHWNIWNFSRAVWYNHGHNFQSHPHYWSRCLFTLLQVIRVVHSCPNNDELTEYSWRVPNPAANFQIHILTTQEIIDLPTICWRWKLRIRQCWASIRTFDNLVQWALSWSKSTEHWSCCVTVTSPIAGNNGGRFRVSHL